MYNTLYKHLQIRCTQTYTLLHITCTHINSHFCSFAIINSQTCYIQLVRFTFKCLQSCSATLRHVLTKWQVHSVQCEWTASGTAFQCVCVNVLAVSGRQMPCILSAMVSGVVIVSVCQQRSSFTQRCHKIVFFFLLSNQKGSSRNRRLILGSCMPV